MGDDELKPLREEADRHASVSLVAGLILLLPVAVMVAVSLCVGLAAMFLEPTQ